MTTSLPFFLLASVLVLLSTEVYSRPQEDGHQDDRPEVPSPDISLKMRQLKDESVMSIILRETEMVDPPVVTTPTHIPEHLLNLLLEKKVEEFALGEEEYLIVYPLNGKSITN
ncbi:TGF_BETA_2 domain-containing protein [Trichonephila clavipes]|nr:TGF_BETA_2 domain-containing protein [Trichonephila clavipes]